MASQSSSTCYHARSRTSTSHSVATVTTSKRKASRPSTARPKTRAKTATSAGLSGDQQIICAIAESRGISPTIGLAFVNLSTTEAVLCQIVDNQTYIKTVHKLHVFQPTEILVPQSFVSPTQSKLLQVLEANLDIEASITAIGRNYWDEVAGTDFIQNLAFKEDVEALKVSVSGHFFATSCLSAALAYIEHSLAISFASHSMRIKHEPSEGSMLIDVSTIRSLELIQNLQNPKSRDCLFGLLNHTLTPMGSKLLRSSILQPSTEKVVLEKRYEALAELTSQERIFFATRHALKPFLGVDRVLTEMVVIPSRPSVRHWEQSVNNVILVKQYVRSIPTVFEAMEGVKSELLLGIRQLCSPEAISEVSNVIDDAINDDVTYQKKPIDLRNQRTYAVKAGVNGLLDVARQTYKEANEDAYQLLASLTQTHELGLELKYDTGRQFFFTLSATDLEERNLPDIFVNAYRKKNVIECQTMDLMKLNQKIMDSHHEVLHMSEQVVQELIENIRSNIASLFKISESIALLDMLLSLAHVAATQDYCRPELTTTLAVKGGRHPIREKIHLEKFVPNDMYATEQSRLQIITGCNMSGKSTYIRSIALMTIMAQIGSFVPADYASFPIRHQLFTRVSLDDSSSSNISTFAAEMRETAFILRNIDASSLAIIDELGRGTSTRDGLAIAVAVAEALVQSGALVWFVTHFSQLPAILAERPGVVNLHLAVGTQIKNSMTMMYKIAQGPVIETRYGLILAKVAGLPPDVITVAEQVSAKLAESRQSEHAISQEVFRSRRKKLMFGLREQLRQAKEGNMRGQVLNVWLKSLQDEFVVRMSKLDDAERYDNLGTVMAKADTQDVTSMAQTDVSDCTRAATIVISEDDSVTETTSSQEPDTCHSTLGVFGPDAVTQIWGREVIASSTPCGITTGEALVRTPSPDAERLARDAQFVMSGALQRFA